MCQTVCLPVAWDFLKEQLCETKQYHLNKCQLWVEPKGIHLSPLWGWSGEGFWNVCATGSGLGGKICSYIWKSWVSAFKSVPRYDVLLLFLWLILACCRSLLPCLIKTYLIVTGRKLARSRSSSSWVPCELLWDWSNWSSLLFHPGRGGPHRGVCACRHVHMWEVSYKFDFSA